MSTIPMRTVSILPASTSDFSVSRSSRPWTCVESTVFCSFLATGQLGFGPLYRRELLFRRLGHEVVAAVEAEVGDEEHVDAEHDERRPNVHDKGRDDRENRQNTRYARGYDAARRAVGALEVRLTATEDDVRERHQ